MIAPAVHAATADVLGECPLWCERTQALFWTDIQGAVLLRMDAAGTLRRWTLPDRLGSFALCETGTALLLGLASGIALFDLESGKTGPIVPIDAEQAATRINDGRCDRQGRFVFGMFNPAEAPIGRFYRVGPGLEIEVLPLPPAGVANSIAFSPDGATLYYADSPARTIWAVAYWADGKLGRPEVFHRLREDEGYPDGSCVDAEGGLWNAQWEGGCVVRYAPDGSETDRIALPVSRPTCPAFGGPALDRLFVTSARIGLSPAALQAQPAAGSLLRLDSVARRGLPESRFRLSR